jgi:hypothetical protein
MHVTVHLSLVITLGLIIWWLIRKNGLKVSHATTAALLGFYLKGSSADPAITSLVHMVVVTIGHLHL